MDTPTLERTAANLPDAGALRALFPEYEFEELIGVGGMGVVYRVQHRRLDRSVALKVLLPDISRDPEFAARFGREARAMARLDHPGVVRVHDFGEREGVFYLAMEFVEGMNLRHLIRSEDFDAKDTLKIIPQICDALEFAHGRGIVHRDIKPENILVDEDLRVRITDFGLAKMLGDRGVAGELTRTEQVFGTPHYMAPEQMRRSAEVDHRADIYSLGVVLYEMLTGELPLGRFRPPSSTDGVEPALDRVVLKSLENEPADRYQSAAAVKTDVYAAQSTSGAAATTAKEETGKGFGSESRLARKLRESLADGGIVIEADLARNPDWEDRPWHALVATLVVFGCLFVPWHESSGGVFVVNGWNFSVYGVPVWSLFPLALLFTNLMWHVRMGRDVSPWAPRIVAGCGLVFAIAAFLSKDDMEWGSLVAIVAFGHMLHLSGGEKEADEEATDGTEAEDIGSRLTVPRDRAGPPLYNRAADGSERRRSDAHAALGRA